MEKRLMLHYQSPSNVFYGVTLWNICNLLWTTDIIYEFNCSFYSFNKFESLSHVMHFVPTVKEKFKCHVLCSQESLHSLGIKQIDTHRYVVYFSFIVLLLNNLNIHFMPSTMLATMNKWVIKFKFKYDKSKKKWLYATKCNCS